MTRFKREAQVLAALNHPNIAAIYGFEESDGKRCLVLELVEGEDLSQKLKANAVPVEDALSIALQIAEALEAAHDKGIIHRDLKPANVMITPVGGVKVLDFGLAKALDGEHGSGISDASMSPTLTSAATRAGVVMGTAAYMSPEQAKGKAADRRSDVFSFGVVLFEMLTHSVTFSGESVSDILASVLKVDPDWSRLPRGIPAQITDLLHRCLEKDPKQRLQSIGEARIALQNALKSPADSGELQSVAQSTDRKKPGTLVWIAALIVVAIIAGLAGRFLVPVDTGPVRTRKFLIKPEGLGVEYPFGPVISPDGRRIAYFASGSLWIRDLNALTAVEIPGSAEAQAPFWSPDGASLGFAIGQRLYRVAASGGQPVALSDMPFGDMDGAAWAPDGTIYLAPSSGPMYRMSASGGDARILFEVDPNTESDFHTPTILPDGKSLLFTTHRNAGRDTIEAFRDGQRKKILRVEGARLEYAAYSPSGHIVFHRRASNSGVWAVAFDPEKLEMTGEPFVLDPDGAFPSISRDGALLYTLGAGGGMRRLVWVNRQGEIFKTIGQPQPSMSFPELSPDGNSILVAAQEGDNGDIWLHDIERGTRTRITFEPETSWAASWMDDGDTIVYMTGSANSNRAWKRPADGTGEPEQYLEGYHISIRDNVPKMIYAHFGLGTAGDLLFNNVNGEEEPEEFLKTRASEEAPHLSPDGRYVIYQSDESGRIEIYLKTFPGGEGKWQVSVDGGVWARWSRKGDEIYYRQGTGLAATFMVVEVDTKGTLRLGTPRPLFSAAQAPDIYFGSGFRSYDVGSDNSRFIMMERAGDTADHVSRLVYSENWFQDYQQRKQ
jgi:Tol biopolymer transport system component